MERIEQLTQQIQNNPNDAKAYFSRGLEYSYHRQYETAIRDFDKAIELDPNFVEAYNNRGESYYNLQQYKRAIADFDAAIGLDSNIIWADDQVYKNRELAYQKFSDEDRAQYDLES